MPKKFQWLAVVGVLCAFQLRAVAETVVVESFENLADWKVSLEKKGPDGSVITKFEKAPDAPPEGKGAIRVLLPGTVTHQLFKDAYPPDGEKWERSQGVSFWVKGDGSGQFGCLALGGGGSNYGYMYVTYFPLKSVEWRKLTVPWRDFVPEAQVAPIGATGSLPISGIATLRIGTNWEIAHNNAKIPPHAYSVGHVQLEDAIPTLDETPAPRAFNDVLRLLAERKPVRIQCMGDSITAGTGLGDAKKMDADRYATVLQNGLRARLGREDIVCFSRAVGGAKMTDARAWVPRDFADDPPDLVTIWYGYNDKSGIFTAESFKRSLNDYIDRVCRATRGKAAILLLATGPGCGPRFTMLDDFADVMRQTAADRGLGCFDMNKTLKAIGKDKLKEYFGDMAHPNAQGHKLIGETLCEFLCSQQKL